MYDKFNFNAISCGGNFADFSRTKERCGILETPHGVVETPAFIFCGTKASVKGVSPQQLMEAQTQIILSNTYHLFSYPGSEYIKKRGGLHKFMGWNGPMLTDSGGFQIFSLGLGSVADEIKGKRSGVSSLLKIDEDGATFRSYWDGSTQILTPEKSMEIQKNLGADFIVAFDECTPFHGDKKYTELSMERSHRWEKRSLGEFICRDDGSQALYGIVHGGVHADLRKHSAEFINDHAFFATAIGGTLGSTKSQMYEVIEMATTHINAARPIHLLGIGGISDIFVGVSLGIDTFDCVHPTRIARHGGALVKRAFRDSPTREHINLKRSEYEHDDNPIELDCDCATCQVFSRAYLHYLLKASELLALHAINIHNIRFMNRLMKEIRNTIKNSGSLKELRTIWC
ncbi:MAG: tRNA guanosine(34) transglycosylase Tgt [Holosporaceae bacterium]|jgi:queuine tRNA-ribosyltransferase|nr:tRNA guanosine(34) transglycosylase Tgt [Holosporaceae bacterium]